MDFIQKRFSEIIQNQNIFIDIMIEILYLVLKMDYAI